MQPGLRYDLQAGISALIACIAPMGYRAAITSGYRTRGQQQKLYRRAQQGMSRYPAAPPGESKHEEGLAVDLVVSPPDGQVVAGRLWQSWGGIWGDTKDDIHFEVPGSALLQIGTCDSQGARARTAPYAAPVSPTPGQAGLRQPACRTVRR